MQNPTHILEPSLAGHDSSSLIFLDINGCVQTWVDIKCIEASLKPYTNPTSDGYVAEATKPLLVLEKDKYNELVEICLQQFCSNMRRNIQCFEPFGYKQIRLWLCEGSN